MDLRLYFRVMWRFRWLMAVGFVAGVGLAFLSMVRVSPSGHPPLRYRTDQKWVSYSTLFVTQGGFPWGRSTLNVAGSNSSPQPQQKAGAPTFADPNRFSNLAVLYSNLATSDPVRELMLKTGPIHGEIEAAPVIMDQGWGATLPLISIAAIASKPDKAVALNKRATKAFTDFLEIQQANNQISQKDRVLVTLVKRATDAKLLKGRSFTVAIVAFLIVMFLFSGIALIFENLRPRYRLIAADDGALAAVAAVPGASPSPAPAAAADGARRSA